MSDLTLPGMPPLSAIPGLVSEMPRTPIIGPQLPKLPELQLTPIPGVTAATFTADNPTLLPLPSLTPGQQVVAASASDTPAASDKVPAWERISILAGGLVFGSVAILGGIAMMTK